MRVRVAVVQTNPVLGRRERNIAHSLSLLEKQAADVYVLPELAMVGYNFDSARQVRALAEPAGTGRTYDALQKFAARKKIHIAYGFAERSGKAVYNSASLIGPAGLVDTYRKTHLFNREKLFFRPGNTGFNVHRLPFGKVGLMVCFDWFFPESMRTLALKGAQLVLHPSNLVLPHCPDGMITRCLENRVFAATANRVGTEKGGEGPLTYIGMSEIVSPRGEILIRLGRRKEGIGAAACDLSRAADKTITRRNDLFKDRRKKFYEP